MDRGSGGDGARFASQMRKVFTVSTTQFKRGRLYLALPGYGEVWLNGKRVDDPETGSRSLSQYDVRMLYHSYDCTEQLRAAKTS